MGCLTAQDVILTLPSMTLPKTTNSSALGTIETNPNLQTNILMESIRKKLSHPEKPHSLH